MFFLLRRSEGKGGKYLEKENHFFAEKKNNREGKGEFLQEAGPSR